MKNSAYRFIFTALVSPSPFLALFPRARRHSRALLPEFRRAPDSPLFLPPAAVAFSSPFSSPLSATPRLARSSTSPLLFNNRSSLFHRAPYGATVSIRVSPRYRSPSPLADVVVSLLLHFPPFATLPTYALPTVFRKQRVNLIIVKLARQKCFAYLLQLGFCREIERDTKNDIKELYNNDRTNI